MIQPRAAAIFQPHRTIPVSYTHLDSAATNDLSSYSPGTFRVFKHSVKTSEEKEKTVAITVRGTSGTALYLTNIRCLEAVSYTHLDVYKRQEDYKGAFVTENPAGDTNQGNGGTNPPEGTKPRFSTGTNGGNPQGGDANPFLHMGFTHLREPKKD